MYCDIDTDFIIDDGNIIYSEPFMHEFRDYQHIGTNFTISCNSGYEPLDPNRTVAICERRTQLEDPQWGILPTTCKSEFC